MLHNYLREVKQKKFWRRISQSEIRKIAAAKKRSGGKRGRAPKEKLRFPTG